MLLLRRNNIRRHNTQQNDTQPNVIFLGQFSLILQDVGLISVARLSVVTPKILFSLYFPDKAQ
jgi:hypothetical protein